PTAVDNSPTGAFQVTAPAPAVPIIVSIAPNKLKRGVTANITVNGLNTSFTGDTRLSFSNLGIVVNSISAVTPTSFVANVTVAADAPLGFRDVTATTAGVTATILDAFLVEAAETVCAPNVSGQLLVSRGAFRLDRRTGQFAQTLTVTNQG